MKKGVGFSNSRSAGPAAWFTSTSSMRISGAVDGLDGTAVNVPYFPVSFSAAVESGSARAVMVNWPSEISHLCDLVPVELTEEPNPCSLASSSELNNWNSIGCWTTPRTQFMIAPPSSSHCTLPATMSIDAEAAATCRATAPMVGPAAVTAVAAAASASATLATNDGATICVVVVGLMATDGAATATPNGCGPECVGAIAPRDAMCRRNAGDKAPIAPP
jgi:hypothetical protein